MTNLPSGKGKEWVAKSVKFAVVERERMAELIKFTFLALKPSPKSLSMPWNASTISHRLYITISYSICSSCIFTFLLCPPLTFALIQILQICRVLMPSCVSLFSPSIHSSLRRRRRHSGIITFHNSQCYSSWVDVARDTRREETMTTAAAQLEHATRGTTSTFGIEAKKWYFFGSRQQCRCQRKEPSSSSMNLQVSREREKKGIR